METTSVPVLVYDGECDFCAIWVDHWRRLTGDRVTYAPSQQVAPQYPQISPDQFASAVQLIMPGGTPDGATYSGAEAVFRLLKDTPNRGWMFWLYEYLPGFAPLSEFVYRLIAAHRDFFYWITILLWGKNLGPHRFVLTRWLFLRLLGVIYLIAFASLAVQIKGLDRQQRHFARAQIFSTRSPTSIPRRIAIPCCRRWPGSTAAMLSCNCCASAA